MEGQGQGRLVDGRLDYTFHSNIVMRQRRITRREAFFVADTGEVIETYPARGASLPCELLLAWIDNRPLHVVLGYNVRTDSYLVISVYEPDLSEWHPGFRERRR